MSRVGDVDVVDARCCRRSPGKNPSRPITWSRCCSSSTWSPTSSRPSAYADSGSASPRAARGSLPVTSVIDQRRPSRTRTTIRPSVLATSGSSTSASWVLVPVGPLRDRAVRARRRLGCAGHRSSAIIGTIRPPQPQGPTWSSGVVDVPVPQRVAVGERAPAPSRLRRRRRRVGDHQRRGRREQARRHHAADRQGRDAEPPPRAVFAGVSMCLGRRVGRPGSVRTRWGRIGAIDPSSEKADDPRATTSSSSEPPASPAS